ncbi:MAG: class GN sortase [Magnetovibrionaceae bacterium]
MSRPAHPTLAWAALGLILLGVALAGQGGWIWAKGLIAQALMDRTWEAVRAGETSARPWPWADFRLVAELKAPAQDESVLVLGDASPRSLAFGPGQLAGSVDPKAAASPVFAAHRDTHFAFLQDLKIGDPLVLETARGERLVYHAISFEIADSRQGGLKITEGGHQLILVTCYPFDAIDPGGPLRFVVRAERT